jgi:two-component system, chemotaxis family, CheB/CheR fusion protein
VVAAMESEEGRLLDQRSAAARAAFLLTIASFGVASGLALLLLLLVIYLKRRDDIAEEKVLHSRSQLAAIVESSEDAIFSKTLDGIITSWNAGARRIFGYEAEEVVGRPITMLLPADRRGEEATILERLRRGERVDHYESVRVTKDGRRIDVALTISPVRDDAGRVIGASKIVRDITERTRAESKLRLVVESAPNGIMMVDGDGRIVLVNAQMETLFGYRRDELLGQPMEMLVPERFRAKHPQYRTDFFAHPEARAMGAGRDLFGRRKDGSEFPVEIGLNPIATAEGLLILGAIVDITERKRAEERLRAAREQAEAASRAKDHFLAVLSHELRTPLTPVLAGATALEGHPGLPADLRAEVNTIRRNVEVEARLIDDLLDLTRAVRGKIELHREPVDVHSALHNALGFCRAEAEAKGLDLALDLRAVQPFVLADPARLRQILWNLIGNAVKFTPRGGRITLGTADDHGRLAIRVSDTGVGIEPEALARIFDAFEQGHRTLERGHGGLGLGLAIAKTLAELHGGRLEGTSAGPGRGATFTLWLDPIPAPPAAPGPCDAAPEPRDAAPAGRPLRILLVEDHEDTRWVVARLLRRRGHLVRTAGGVREALDAAEAGAFDLLISDLGLPDGSGLDLMRHLDGRPGLRAIALSGFGMDEDRAESRYAGFAHHLTKPVEFRDLERTILQVTATT